MQKSETLPRLVSRFMRFIAVTVTLALPLAPGLSAQAAGPGLDPPSVTQTVNPGASFTVTKTVHTPTLPPLPDIVFLSDTTGSMGAVIANVQANIGTITTNVLTAAPNAQFAVANYKDGDPVFCSTDPYAFRLDQAMTGSAAAVSAAVGTWVAAPGDGCDDPESQLNALYQVATSGSIGFRPGSTRIIVWDGDAPGHDPSFGNSIAAVEAALVSGGANAPILVLAIPVIDADTGLDLTGQATAIAAATGGTVLPGATPDQVSATILAALQNLPATTTMASDCAAPISTTFTPASVTVPSGTDAVFTETISVAANAVQGQTYSCKDWALINGVVMADATGATIYETKKITVADVTPPVAACVPTTNPAGAVVPVAGQNPKSGQNPDGFYQLVATDNVGVASIVVKDGGSTFVSGTFSSGDKVKIIQAPGATPSDVRPGPGVIVSILTLKGDALLAVTDTSGNVTTVSCLVPPPPK